MVLFSAAGNAGGSSRKTPDKKDTEGTYFFVHSMENCYFILQQGENMIYNKEIMC